MAELHVLVILTLGVFTSALNGIFGIRTKSRSVWALCDQEVHSGGWTVIQQRTGGVEAFWNRSWRDYKVGFGSIHPNGDFWLGNDVIHELSTQRGSPLLLRVEMFGDRTPHSDLADQFFVSEYDFWVEDERNNYKLHVTAHRPKKDKNNQLLPPDPEYVTGNASFGWFDITSSDGSYFSTIDNVNDPMTKCISDYHLGGWWTKFCGVVSLNGEYRPVKWGGGYGLAWLLNGKRFIHPQRTRMLIRQPLNAFKDSIINSRDKLQQIVS